MSKFNSCAIAEKIIIGCSVVITVFMAGAMVLSFVAAASLGLTS